MYCDNYMGDSGYHLYVHCMRKGIVTALQCTQCEYREISDVRVDAKKEFILRKEKVLGGEENAGDRKHN